MIIMMILVIFYCVHMIVVGIHMMNVMHVIKLKHKKTNLYLLINELPLVYSILIFLNILIRCDYKLVRKWYFTKENNLNLTLKNYFTMYIYSLENFD